MWKHSTNLKWTLGKHNSLSKVLTGGSKDRKAGQLCPSTVKNYLFLKKEACFPQVVGEEEAEGS